MLAKKDWHCRIMCLSDSILVCWDGPDVFYLLRLPPQPSYPLDFISRLCVGPALLPARVLDNIAKHVIWDWTYKYIYSMWICICLSLFIQWSYHRDCSFAKRLKGISGLMEWAGGSTLAWASCTRTCFYGESRVSYFRGQGACHILLRQLVTGISLRGGRFEHCGVGKNKCSELCCRGISPLTGVFWSIKWRPFTLVAERLARQVVPGGPILSDWAHCLEIASMSTSTTPDPGGLGTSIPNQLAMLVPTFDPAKDDLKTFTQKIELLTTAWPDNRYGELATRIILLNCSGSAFQKLQLNREDLTKNEKKSVTKIIEILGGTWGQVDLERKYESAEKALYHCIQKQDESNDSYLARADILWTEVLAKGMKLEELQSYITLRGSSLTPEDKKRVVVERHSTGGSVLTMKRVSKAIRMLGAGFFHGVTGQRRSKTRIYDATAMVTEDDDTYEGASWDPTMMTSEEHVAEDDDLMEALIADGDSDATFISVSEGAANELLQSDAELAGCYTAYLEARRRLTEKAKFRGFWPVSKPKGKGKGVKGKFGKNNFKGNPRKSLAHRIMNSTCRRCGQVGHWRAECPLNQGGNSSASSTAATSTAVSSVPQFSHEVDSLPLEFLNLSEVDLKSIDASSPGFKESFVLMGINQEREYKSPYQISHVNPTGNRSKLRECYHRIVEANPTTGKCNHHLRAILRNKLSEACHEPRFKGISPVVCHDETIMLASSCSHGTKGVLDTGATKTVVGEP